MEGVTFAYPFAFALVNLPDFIEEKIKSWESFSFLRDLLVENGFPIKEIIGAKFDKVERCLVVVFKDECNIMVDYVYRKARELERWFEYHSKGREDLLHTNDTAPTGIHGWLIGQFDAHRFEVVGYPFSLCANVSYGDMYTAKILADASNNPLVYPGKEDMYELIEREIMKRW